MRDLAIRNTYPKKLIILGGGIKYSKAENNLNNFLKKLNVPIVTTWSGVDLIDHSDNKYIGNIHRDISISLQVF